MANKGSRKNPYEWAEYTPKVSSNTWQGGWVTSHGELSYRAQISGVYAGRCAKSYPVPYDMFCEMIQNSIWLGGWYINEQNIMKYRSFNGEEYDNTLCEASNPCSLSLYGEMVSNEIWEGGWIQESNGSYRYVQSLQFMVNMGAGSGNGHGSGNGSGSGSGSGPAPDGGSGSGFGELETLGCSIKAGNILIGDITDNSSKVAELHASWTQGMTIGQNELSAVTISIVPYNSAPYIFDANGIYAIWQNAYELSICGTYTYTFDQHSYLVPVNLDFVIPEEFRQYD